MSSSFSEGQPLLLQAIERNPLTIAPDTLVVEAIAQINAARSSYTPIAQQQKLLGIFTERDIVRLTANETPLEGITISQVMTQNLITADCTMSEVQPFGAKECNSGTLKGAAIQTKRRTTEGCNPPYHLPYRSWQYFFCTRFAAICQNSSPTRYG